MGSTGKGNLDQTWRKLAVCWVKLEERRGVICMAREESMEYEGICCCHNHGILWMDQTAWWTSQETYKGSLLCSNMEEMRNFHNLLKQKPSSLFMLLGWINLSWHPTHTAHVTGFCEDTHVLCYGWSDSMFKMYLPVVLLNLGVNCMACLPCVDLTTFTWGWCITKVSSILSHP
jgi:hypothetical protein